MYIASCTVPQYAISHESHNFITKLLNILKILFETQHTRQIKIPLKAQLPKLKRII